MDLLITPDGKPVGLTTLDAYQDAAGAFTIPGTSPEERVFGLLEEAGEVAGVFKRLFRGDYGTPEAMARLHKELGDVLWYTARIAADNNWTLSDIANTNISKLTDRKNRNALQGSGDNR